MKPPLTVRVGIIQDLFKNQVTCRQAVDLLHCSLRTIQRYRRMLIEHGPDGLRDKRAGHNFRLTPAQKQALKQYKQAGPWRSARKIRDDLKLPVDAVTVWRHLKAAGLNRVNVDRLKPLERFVAKLPNDLWQADIMGRINHPYLGQLYLIAALDDHSRFILAADWYQRQTKINVFSVWYQALRRWGLPQAMLQDRGSQYQATARIGQADYQYYAQLLRINLIFARKARTKGKLERFFRFIQRDFVRENLHLTTMEAFRGAWRVWLARYNYTWTGKARGLNDRTPAQAYHPSARKADLSDISQLLIIEERRKVSRESTISLYGRSYRVPPGYIDCRIWVKIKCNKLYFEANNHIFWKQRLKP